ncbi:mannose-6-phosphate isomerase, class I [Spirochaetia bacterium]|nr:mannose-6-phosphate isomerase, class I [Spirochaetia bacterium]
MAEFFKLRNQIKHYEWGSPDCIPRLMGMANNDGRPWAELWMGSHPAAPSMVNVDGNETSLGSLIAGNPEYWLGKRCAEQYGGLPFLFKLLAAGKPLSIQAHPNRAQAQEGFERENRAGLAADAPNRNYKDANHKPEIICAITPFTGMCGFRPPAEIRRLLEAFLAPASTAGTVPATATASAAETAPAPLREGFVPLLQTLDTADTGAALRNFLGVLFGLSAGLRKELTGFILSQGHKGAAAGSIAGDADSGVSPAQWELMLRFAQLYPNDPALIAPLYLNTFRLEPGEAIFLRAGVLHAYMSGLGVELMANSDNVLRGGLTPKHIDVPELMKVLDFSPLRPEILKARSSPALFRYPADCGEFSLAAMRGEGDETAFAETGPAICVVTEGELQITDTGGGETILKPGESIFIPAGAGRPLRFSGNFALYVATLPVT